MTIGVHIYGHFRTATITGHTPDGDVEFWVPGSGIWRKCHETRPPSFFGIDPGTTHDAGTDIEPPAAANPSIETVGGSSFIMKLRVRYLVE